MSGLGRLLTSSVSVAALDTTRTGADSPADIVGPLCTPLDVIARDVMLPPLSSHSLVGIPNVGAYGLTSSLVAFLSHRAPAEVVYRGTEIITARRLVMNREQLA
jgi:diaminopimelate decarboxylase